MADDLLTYEQFRTGYTYADIYHMIYNRPHKRRNGVLGYWRELKQRMYAEYLRQYSIGQTLPVFIPSDEPIPD